MTTARYSFIKIGLVTLVALSVGVLWVRGETVETTFATGQGQAGLELKIDNKTYYNGILQPKLSWELKDLKPGKDKFWNFKDVKPGDWGTTTISLHVKQNPAWMCLDIQHKDFENGRNEPEALVDNDDEGELSDTLEFFAWHDDGDSVFEVGEEPLFGTTTQKASELLQHKYALADAEYGTAYKPNKTGYIGINWCAGEMTVDVDEATITCDGSNVGNETQTDSMIVDVKITAVSAGQLPNFLCNGGYQKKPRGNNGHGNDDDHNDDSNPGASNDPNDNTDDDGLPPGQQATGGPSGQSDGEQQNWHAFTKKKSVWPWNKNWWNKANL